MYSFNRSHESVGFYMYVNKSRKMLPDKNLYNLDR